MPYILWFDKAGKEALGLVGGKNASLGELMRADIPVPPGFSVTTEAYLEFVSGDLKERIERILSRIDPQEMASLEEKSQLIRKLIVETPFPKKVQEEIQSNYQALCQVFDTSEMPVAVSFQCHRRRPSRGKFCRPTRYLFMGSRSRRGP